MNRGVSLESGSARYLQNISIGSHRILADEPSDSGGADLGPNPYELLMAALGACTSITVRMYAERKKWPLEGVRIGLSCAKVHAQDSAESDARPVLIDRIELEIALVGDLTEDQRTRLLEIANHCPVHRTLTSQVQVVTRSVPSLAPQ